MAYGYAISLVPEPVRSIAYGSISGTYAGIGTAITNPSRIIVIQNLTDADVMISEDGINDHYPLPAKSGQIWDYCSNQSHAEGAYKAAGTRFYVKLIGTATMGSVYLSTQYGLNG
jgi:hypothetical protein